MPLEVHVVTPEREVWSGSAEIVIARGVDGEVGILAGHAPLLVRLGIGPLKIHNEHHKVWAVVDGGFLHVTSEGGATRVDVLASQAELASEIDLDTARSRKEEFERRLLQDRDDLEAKAGLAKALARIDLLG